MQQRRLRPGDVLDDYCPRERRITDHAIVAMIDDDIKQTRCVVCDAEHEYKQGRVPPQRRRKAQSALFSQVLEGLQAPARLAQQADDPEIDAPALADANGEAELEALAGDDDAPMLAVAEAAASASADDDEPVRVGDEGPVRRPLIRATLPKAEGQQPPARAIPEFTMHQPINGHPRRPGGRRRSSPPHQHGSHGPMRFGRGGPSQRAPGQRQRSGGPRRGKKR